MRRATQSKGLMIILSICGVLLMVPWVLSAASTELVVWHFDEGQGDIVFPEQSAGCEGTLYKTKWVPGKHGYALEFLPVSSKAVFYDCDAASSLPFTVAAWVRVRQDSGNFGAIIWRAKGTSEGWWLGFHHSGMARFVIEAREGYVSAEGGPSLKDGAWHHLAVVASETAIILYVDGEPVSTTTIEKPVVLSGQPLTIGGNLRWMGLDSKFWGDVDEVTIYNKALSAEEVDALYRSEAASSE